MANIVKRGNSWQARTNCKGVRRSSTFPTKAEAVAWAAEVESEILSGRKGVTKAVKFSKLLERYAQDVAPQHKGARWEQIKIKMICQEPIANIKLADLTANDFATWRDKRLKQVANGTVIREWTLISAALNIAVKEWGWLNKNPLKDVKRPATPPSRDKVFSDQDIALLTHTLGVDGPPKTVTARVGYAMLFAIETAMRAGEIVGLKWSDVKGKVATISDGKTASAKRKVPLSKEALRILSILPKDGDTCFGLSTQQIDSLFRKAKTKAGIKDLHFHDTRATAVGRLAKKVDILDLAKIIGHKDLRMLQVYYRDSAEEIADRLG